MRRHGPTALARPGTVLESVQVPSIPPCLCHDHPVCPARRGRQGGALGYTRQSVYQLAARCGRHAGSCARRRRHIGHVTLALGGSAQLDPAPGSAALQRDNQGEAMRFSS